MSIGTRDRGRCAAHGVWAVVNAASQRVSSMWFSSFSSQRLVSQCRVSVGASHERLIQNLNSPTISGSGSFVSCLGRLQQFFVGAARGTFISAWPKGLSPQGGGIPKWCRF